MVLVAVRRVSCTLNFKERKIINSELNMVTDEVCKFHKYGHCKFFDRYQKKHSKELCENSNSEIINCSLRHPRACKFFQAYGRCKFEPCSYRHVDTREMILIKELQSSLEAKTVEVETLRNLLTAQTETVKRLEYNLDENSANMAILKTELLAVVKSGPTMNALPAESRIKEVEDTNYILLHAIDDLEKGVKVLKLKMSRLTSCFECEDCEKILKSEVQLKNHRLQDHGYRDLVIP